MKVGDMVIVTTGRFDDSMETQKGLVGRIRRIKNEDSLPISVSFPDGTFNTYDYKDLAILSKLYKVLE